MTGVSLEAGQGFREIAWGAASGDGAGMSCKRPLNRHGHRHRKPCNLEAHVTAALCPSIALLVLFVYSSPRPPTYDPMSLVSHKFENWLRPRQCLHSYEFSSKTGYSSALSQANRHSLLIFKVLLPSYCVNASGVRQSRTGNLQRVATALSYAYFSCLFFSLVSFSFSCIRQEAMLCPSLARRLCTWAQFYRPRGVSQHNYHSAFTTTVHAHLHACADTKFGMQDAQ